MTEMVCAESIGAEAMLVAATIAVGFGGTTIAATAIIAGG